MKNLIVVSLSLVLMMFSLASRADGDLEGTVIKYATGPFDVDGNGSVDYIIVDIDDSVATECAIYPLGNDVAWMPITSVSPMKQTVIDSIMSAKTASATIKIGYHTIDTDATLGVDICIVDNLVAE